MNFFMQIPAQKQYLSIVRMFLKNVCDLNGISEKKRDDLISVLGEAVSNAVKHAYTVGDYSEDEKIVDVEIDINNDAIYLKVSDYGCGFPDDMSEKFDAIKIDEKVKMRKSGGLGIYMIKKISDEVEFKKEDGKNSVIIKFLRN